MDVSVCLCAVQTHTVVWMCLRVCVDVRLCECYIYIMRPWHSCSTVRVHARALMDCLLRGGGGRGGEGREKGRSRALTNAPAWARTQKSSRARAGTNARGRTHTHTHTHTCAHMRHHGHTHANKRARAHSRLFLRLAGFLSRLPIPVPFFLCP